MQASCYTQNGNSQMFLQSVLSAHYWDIFCIYNMDGAYRKFIKEHAGYPKFKDSDLMGIPMRVTVGKKISDGEVEFKLRTADMENIKIEDVINRVKEEFKNNKISIR